MTAKQLYEACLIEINKDNAPNILLEDFNYFANKTIYLYINKRYNIYDINQQTTDDLRVLKATAILLPKKINTYSFLSQASDATYECNLPDDYLHILNCICVYDVVDTTKCYDGNTLWRAAATRLTADAYSLVLDNFWNRPSYKRPYYYLHHVNTPIEKGSDFTRVHVPTNILTDSEIETTEFDDDGSEYVEKKDIASIFDGTYPVEYESGISIAKIKKDLERPSRSVITNSGDEISFVERGAAIRYGNSSNVRMEIRYGTDDSVFVLSHVLIDYIKTPQHIRLTQKQLDKTMDTSQVLEFPDYVCQEIVNELVHVLMENILDLRIQTHPIVTLSIANPTQQLTDS